MFCRMTLFHKIKNPSKPLTTKCGGWMRDQPDYQKIQDHSGTI